MRPLGRVISPAQPPPAPQLLHHQADVLLRAFWTADCVRRGIHVPDAFVQEVGKEGTTLSPVSAFLLRPLDDLDASASGTAPLVDSEGRLELQWFSAEALRDWQRRLLPPELLHRARARPPEWDAAGLQLASTAMEQLRQVKEQDKEQEAEEELVLLAALRLRGAARAVRESAVGPLTQLAAGLAGGPVMAHAAAALLCGFLERRLGDALAPLGPVPPLLRDLLGHPALRLQLGASLARALDAALGHPAALNLRNVIWHGFVGPRTTHALRVGPLLLALLLTVEHHLPSASARPLTPLPDSSYWVGPPLPPLRLEAKALAELLQKSGAMPHGDQRLQLLLTALLPPPDLPALWQLALLLPLLEMQLRLLFVAAHHLPAQMLRAEGRAYYSTLEMLLARDAPRGGPNRLLELLGSGPLELLHDLLVHPAGPRIRDRLAHGELALTGSELPESILRAVRTAVVALAGRWSVGAGAASAEPVLEAVAAYRSRFHPRRLLRVALYSVAQELARAQASLLKALHLPALAECRSAAADDTAPLARHLARLAGAAHEVQPDRPLWCAPPVAESTPESALVWLWEVGSTLHGSPVDLAAASTLRRVLLLTAEVTARFTERLEFLSERVQSGAAGHRQQSALRRLLGCGQMLLLLWHAAALRCELDVRLLECNRPAPAAALASRLVPLLDKALSGLAAHQWDRLLQLVEPMCCATDPPHNTPGGGL